MIGLEIVFQMDNSPNNLHLRQQNIPLRFLVTRFLVSNLVPRSLTEIVTEPKLERKNSPTKRDVLETGCALGC
jgi:hypothetical protein